MGSERVIAASVRRLRPHHAAALLDAAVERLRARANRGAALTAWIRAVLLAHTAYLMAAPGVLPVLASLSQARSQGFRGFLVDRLDPCGAACAHRLPHGCARHAARARVALAGAFLEFAGNQGFLFSRFKNCPKLPPQMRALPAA